MLKQFVEEMYSLTGSTSILNYGAVKPANVVSLNPDMTKTEKATGFISGHRFKDVINTIIQNYKKQKT